MKAETLIPVLPCFSLKTNLSFYMNLGFEILYQREGDSPYASVAWKGIEIHFFEMREMDPRTSYGACHISSTNVEGLYESFLKFLKRNGNEMPQFGIPKMTSLQKSPWGGQGFELVDPGGNRIHFVQRIEQRLGEDAAAVERETDSQKNGEREADLFKVIFPFW
ncbi:bleomycin resistance protein [Leptospira idonii]|uniref:VOC family protein n=1 Tax=Leptospira idonii TaxID=1193500 RepID=A0A4R9M525_9LEPT|nr:VOC family protein [Leptospira idonii]TGN21061.1 VOC family protein [Leptospira idonii]